MTRTVPKLLLALATAALLSCLLAAAAIAEPRLELQMTRTHQPTHVGDERLAYELKVKNDASLNPQVGDSLSCDGVGAGFGNPPPDVTIAWLRGGTPIEGATEDTYVTVAADAGKSIQCMVRGANDPGALLPGAYAPIAALAVSLPPVVVEPVPASTPPGGSSRPDLSGPLIAATPSGTATATAGSKVLTDVVSAAGSGTFANGSPVVEGVTMSSGTRFEALQAVAGSCVAADSRIAKVEETAAGVFRVTLDQAATCSGAGTLEAGAQPFGLSQEISGSECVPPGAKIIRATNQGGGGEPTVRFIEMDVAATCTKADVAIAATSTLVCKEPVGWSAGSAIAWSYRWLRNGEPIAGETSPEYEVQSADAEPPSSLQCEATAEDGEGNRAIALSFAKPTNPVPPSPYAFPSGSSPSVGFENETSGEVALELEAPAGAETHVFGAVGGDWDCARTAPNPPIRASVRCTLSDVLAPQASYPTLQVAIALGENPPQPLITKAKLSGGGDPEPVSAEDQYAIPEPALPFGFEVFEVEVLDELGGDYAEAGGHPFSAGATLEFNWHESPSGGKGLVGATKEVRTQTPPGFVGNPQALAELCPSIADVVRLPASSCPAGSVAGAITIRGGFGAGPKDFPIYALEPEEGVPAQFAFKIGNSAYTLAPELRPEDGYAIDLVTQPLGKWPEVFASEVTLCGFGAIVETSSGIPIVKGCRKASDPLATERPFMTLPTKCGDPASATTKIIATSWEGEEGSAEDTLAAPEGCEDLQFEPSLKARPTTNRADSPTGLEVSLQIPQNEDPEGRATAHLRKAVVTLPEGLVVNPSGANGLGACSEAQVGMKGGVPDNSPVECPDASKLGSVQVTTPILDHPLPGALYLATPHANPFDSLIALYLVVESPSDGITIKLAGKSEADPATGQLTSTFDQNPQAPVEEVELDIPGGALAPLRTPTACGQYTTASSLTPWSAPQSGPPASATDSWQIAAGPNGGACAASLPHTPSFEAGTASAIAGAHAPFLVKLRREDGTQRFSQVTLTPPPGLVAKLAGTVRCPDSALAAAQGKSGRSEQSSPSCPPGSELGSVIAAAGAGPAPFHATGKAYLAGPYKGAPLSIAIITPAVAGPFDLGTVLVRAAAYVDPSTAQITVKSDPLPQILQGVPLDIRSATVAIDRPGFVLNPTSCDPMAVNGELLSSLGQTASLQSRFQLAECGRLPFKPKLALRLKGKTKRGDFQGLKATLSAKGGEANIASASVTMPRSAFLAQEHIRTVCTRVQFAADQCPKGSIYGKAKAITPLLEEPLSGPVYLRSSDNKLPDLVVALKGPDSLPIEIELAGRTDSRKGALRNTFDVVPDAPVSKFTLELFGGKKGLIVNSRNLCGALQRASVRMSAHNGKVRSFRPAVRNGCRKGRGGKKKRRG